MAIESPPNVPILRLVGNDVTTRVPCGRGWWTTCGRSWTRWSWAAPRRSCRPTRAAAAAGGRPAVRVGRRAAPVRAGV